MKTELEQLIELLPPLPNTRNRDVDWKRLEEAVGIEYPGSYKEFIGTYGSSCWLDHLVPLYTPARNDEEIQDYLDTVKRNLLPLRRDMIDDNGTRWKKPALYPTENGLFPFLVDFDGGLYCWKTDTGDPERWPIIHWDGGPYGILEHISIIGMFLSWLKQEPPMLEIWGDFSDLTPEDISLR